MNMHMGMGTLPPWGSGAWGQWQFPLETGLLCLVALGLYVLGLRRLAAAGHRTSPWRVASFAVGLISLTLTLASPIDAYAMSLFWVHMVEHLLLIMIAPTFLVLGKPLSVIAAALGREQKPWGRTLSFLVHPVVALAVYSAVIIGTHLTGFMDSMSMHAWLMDAEQVGYLIAGFLLMEAMIGSEPVQWRLPYAGRLLFMLVSMVPDTLVGIVLMQSQNTPFPMYMSMRPTWALDAHQDIVTAGGIMWAGGDILMMLMGFGVAAAALWGPSRGDLLGERLNRARHQTLMGHLAAAGVDTDAVGDIGADDSDAALAAYNEMLARLAKADPHG
ncbi:MAG: cytochrome c oxidase assembly protein [Marmoricola sp.]